MPLTICPCDSFERPPLAPLLCPGVPAGRPLCGDDPGVGNSIEMHLRRPRWFRTCSSPPDNGLAMPPARALAREKEQDENIGVRRRRREPASETFHLPARRVPRRPRPDPDGARRQPRESHARGGPGDAAAMDDLSPATDPVDPRPSRPEAERDDAGDPVAADGEVLAIDRFGNVVTNVLASFDPRPRLGPDQRGASPRSPRRRARSIRAIGSSPSESRLRRVRRERRARVTARSTSDPGVGTAVADNVSL